MTPSLPASWIFSSAPPGLLLWILYLSHPFPEVASPQCLSHSPVAYSPRCVRLSVPIRRWRSVYSVPIASAWSPSYAHNGACQSEHLLTPELLCPLVERSLCYINVPISRASSFLDRVVLAAIIKCVHLCFQYSCDVMNGWDTLVYCAQHRLRFSLPWE